MNWRRSHHRFARVSWLGAQTVANADPGWLAGLKAFGTIAAVIVIGLYLTRPLLRIVAATDSREVFTAVTRAGVGRSPSESTSMFTEDSWHTPR